MSVGTCASFLSLKNTEMSISLLSVPLLFTLVHVLVYFLEYAFSCKQLLQFSFPTDCLEVI